MSSRLQVPEYNNPLRLLTTSRSVCFNGLKYDVVIVVKSAVVNFEARKAFRGHMRDQRRRYPHLKVGYVFSVGLPRRHGGRWVYRQGALVKINSRAGDRLDAFEGKAEEVMAKNREEIRAYDDLIVGDYEDTYYNLTLKTITNYRWMSAFCRSNNVKLFIILDDDHWVNFTMVEEFLQRVPENKRNYTIFGIVGKGDGAARSPSSEQYLPKSEIPWNMMATYMWGFASVIGPSVVDDVAIATAFTRTDVGIDDVYLGLVFHRLGVQLVRESSMFPEGHMPASPPVMIGPEAFFKQHGLM